MCHPFLGLSLDTTTVSGHNPHNLEHSVNLDIRKRNRNIISPCGFRVKLEAMICLHTAITKTPLSNIKLSNVVKREDNIWLSSSEKI